VVALAAGPGPDVEGLGILTEFEREALRQHRAKKGTTSLSPHLEAQLYEVFLQGNSCETIAKLNPGIPIGQVLETRLQRNWDGRRERYLEELMASAKANVTQIQLEALEFLRTHLAVIHKAFGVQAKKFLQSGNLKDFPKTDLSWKQYKEQLELLMKLTGQAPVERKEVSGTVTHEHHVVPSPAVDVKPVAVLPGGMPSATAADALAVFEASLVKKT